MMPYVVSNGPGYTKSGFRYDCEDLHWAVIWVNEIEEILELYRQSYFGTMHDNGELLVFEDLDWTDVSAKVSIAPMQETPYFERRLSVEREAGFKMPDESYCENCEMAAYSFDQYRVCDNCYLCKECRQWLNENDQSVEVCPECLPELTVL
jgi:hypothetical protein